MTIVMTSKTAQQEKNEEHIMKNKKGEEVVILKLGEKDKQILHKVIFTCSLCGCKFYVEKLLSPMWYRNCVRSVMTEDCPQCGCHDTGRESGLLGTDYTGGKDNEREEM